MHWYLLIREINDYTYMESKNQAEHLCLSKQDYRTIITRTPEHIPHSSLQSIISPKTCFCQQDGINCGLFLLIHD